MADSLKPKVNGGQDRNRLKVGERAINPGAAARPLRQHEEWLSELDEKKLGDFKRKDGNKLTSFYSQMNSNLCVAEVLN